jgi:phage shock protein PspC (stress-responsive transcriptional regulator)
MNYKPLKRKKENRMLYGVSSGIASYFGIDPVIVRLFLVFLFIATGFVPVVVLYAAVVLLVPYEDAADAS